MFISPGTFPQDPRFVGIGMIVPWAKNIVGVPALSASFVECNGQVLNDAESPLNGKTMPSLNATNSFLRGNATSGTTGGEATTDLSVHGVNGGVSWGAANGSPFTYTNLPPYYDVVWVIRVK